MEAQYNRVSTIEQNVSRQEPIKGARVYFDVCSGKIPFNERKEALKLIKQIEKGVVTKLYIHSIDRLGRSTLDIFNTLKYLNDHQINVVSNKEGFSTLNDDGEENTLAKLMIGILSTISEFEYNRLRERQMEGIAKAKERGIYKNNGRRLGSGMTDDEFLLKPKSINVIKRIKQGHSFRDTAKLVGVSLSTVQKVMKIAGYKL